MMFYAPALLAATIAQVKDAQELDRHRRENLPPEIYEKIKEVEEVARKERIEERRHKEICSAIRSTSFWRFGS